jgi:hypothetical protein
LLRRSTFTIVERWMRMKRSGSRRDSMEAMVARIMCEREPTWNFT